MAQVIEIAFKERREHVIAMEKKRKSEFKQSCFKEVIDFMMDENNPWNGEKEKKKFLKDCQDYIGKIYRDEVSHVSYCPF